MSIGCYSDMIQDLHCKLESNRLANQIFPKALSTRRIKTNNAKASRMSITNVKQGCRWRVRRLLLQLFLIQTYLAIPQVYFYFNCFIIHCKLFQTSKFFKLDVFSFFRQAGYYIIKARITIQRDQCCMATF